MPLLVGTQVPHPFVNDLAVIASDVPRATWIAPDGTEWPLSDTAAAWFTTKGVKGLGAAPVAFTADEVARGGTVMRHVQPGARLITWPLFIEGIDHAAFLANWRGLARAFASTRRLGPGRLVIARPDGTRRQIRAYYQDGFDEGASDAGARWQTCAITLYCPDPFWTDVDPTVITRYHATGGADYLTPYPSVRSSQLLGGSAINNPGDVEVWPQFRITGPATSINAVHTDLGASWALDPVAYRGTALQAAETITISTDPPSVRGPDGSGWSGALNWPAANLWPLNPDNNNITLTIAGEDVGTSVQMSFLARYETA